MHHRDDLNNDYNDNIRRIRHHHADHDGDINNDQNNEIIVTSPKREQNPNQQVRAARRKPNICHSPKERRKSLL
ncbi:hypothetical protein M9Y10_041390 [Tritrichomonas musculus]|uniref:Uncharacterized protein n=1 Tax=Tritrichomonas musculus TaxID=1915356 RepID=A0ABR2K601_9EUKA